MITFPLTFLYQCVYFLPFCPRLCEIVETVWRNCVSIWSSLLWSLSVSRIEVKAVASAYFTAALISQHFLYVYLLLVEKNKNALVDDVTWSFCSWNKIAGIWKCFFLYNWPFKCGRGVALTVTNCILSFLFVVISLVQSYCRAAILLIYFFLE